MATVVELRRPPARFKGRAGGTSVGLLGTYPPRRCGIATFTAALRAAMVAAGNGTVRSRVVRCVDGLDTRPGGSEVIGQLVAGDRGSRVAAAQALSAFDVVIVQHEFGIYGGQDGSDVLDVVEQITAPVVVTLHTVLRTPSPNQRRIIERLGGTVDALVVQSHAAASRLQDAHVIAGAAVRVIPHGARLNLGAVSQDAPVRRPTILTWGLIGRGKGLEFGVRALVGLRDLRPLPRYVIAGQTHPRVLEAEGERYRSSLVELSEEIGVAHMVEFDNAYATTEEILARSRAADIVMLPYLSGDQVVSGVLVEALASGKPVVATRFPHAEEMLSAGSGIVVPRCDADALGTALRTLITDPATRRRMRIVARRQAQALAWETVGQTYLELAYSVCPTTANRDPVVRDQPPVDLATRGR